MLRRRATCSTASPRWSTARCCRSSDAAPAALPDARDDPRVRARAARRRRASSTPSAPRTRATSPRWSTTRRAAPARAPTSSDVVRAAAGRAREHRRRRCATSATPATPRRALHLAVDAAVVLGALRQRRTRRRRGCEFALGVEGEADPADRADRRRRRRADRGADRGRRASEERASWPRCSPSWRASTTASGRWWRSSGRCWRCSPATRERGRAADGARPPRIPTRGCARRRTLIRAQLRRERRRPGARCAPTSSARGRASARSATAGASRWRSSSQAGVLMLDGELDGGRDALEEATGAGRARAGVTGAGMLRHAARRHPARAAATSTAPASTRERVGERARPRPRRGRRSSTRCVARHRVGGRRPRAARASCATDARASGSAGAPRRAGPSSGHARAMALTSDRRRRARATATSTAPPRPLDGAYAGGGRATRHADRRRRSGVARPRLAAARGPAPTTPPSCSAPPRRCAAPTTFTNPEVAAACATSCARRCGDDAFGRPYARGTALSATPLGGWSRGSRAAPVGP